MLIDPLSQLTKPGTGTRAAIPEPLECIRVAAQCLERGELVPPPVAGYLASALRRYLGGESDITKNLGLRPRRGGTHETPLRLERAGVRDATIRAVYEAMPGEKKNAKAEQTAHLLRDPPNPLVTEEAVFRYVMQLHEQHGGNLPTSARQVLRIVDGETVESRKGRRHK